jgi:opacity protein-like surface antigen
MKKALAIALAMTGLAGSAYAADWVPPKVPDVIPDNLTWYGITPIGVLDLGGAYQTNGRRSAPSFRASNIRRSRPPATTRGSRSRPFNIAPFSNHLSV